MKSVLFVASSLLLASSALAQNAGSATDRSPSAPTESTSGGPVSADDQIVCRRIEADTGTRLKGNRRICMTRREWRAHDRQN